MDDDSAEAMRLANLAAVRRYAAAWVGGDFPAMMATYADDFVLHWFGENPFATVHVGRDAAMAALMAFTQRTGRKLVEIVDVMAGEHRAVIIAREQVTIGDETRVIERALVYRIEAGLLAECWVYDQDQRFIDRALSA